MTVGIAGQLLVALWLDASGALGLPKVALTASRAGGVLLVFAGVYLVRRTG